MPRLFFFCSACHNEHPSSITDTPLNGTINISVDESFRPVIDEQIKVYENSYPGTKIIAHYKPEASCLKDLFNDTTNRMAIVTRGLSANEEAFFKDSLGYVPQWGMMATDAIAVIVNKNSPDTMFSIEDLKQRLLGKTSRKKLISYSMV